MLNVQGNKIAQIMQDFSELYTKEQINELLEALKTDLAGGGSEGNISGKADKVLGATAGNFAGLDENGNLTDSGMNAGNLVFGGGLFAFEINEDGDLIQHYQDGANAPDFYINNDGDLIERIT